MNNHDENMPIDEPGLPHPGRNEREERRDERDQRRDERRGGRGRPGQGPGRGHGFDPRAGRGFGGFGGPGGSIGPMDGPMGPMGGLDLGPMGEGRGPRGGRGGNRGPGRGRRGDVRNAVLALLAEQELNGYGLINGIAEKSNGLWRPSAGSIYPALGLLEDEGLIEPSEAEGKKVFRLTGAGRAHVQEHAEQIGRPWEKVAEPHRGFLDVRADMHQLGMAVQQVVVTGDADQVEAARKILERARKDVYRLLAGDDEA